MSATIPDIIPPSTPILISPEDGANVDTAYPVFQWYESTDNKGMSHYQFILDSRVWFDNIPLTSFANEEYSLHYDPGLGIYTLVANSPLEHGTHRWQIVAFDHGDNRAASTTWTFNVFVDNPNFVLRRIGDVRVRISATDPNSVPAEPITLFATDPLANEPWLIALGDANLSVDLTVTIPDRADQFFSENTDASGNWSLQLGILPRNKIISLNFVVTDVVGHKSYIKDLKIIIRLHYWPPTIVPTPILTQPPPTTYPPTGVVATITPYLTSYITPYATPKVSISISPTIIQPLLTPTPPLAEPGIRIPIIPPKEIIHEVAQEIKESLPSRVATLVSDLTGSNTWQALRNYWALILTLLLPIITYLLVLFKFYQFWSFKALKEVLFAIWPWSKNRKNLIYEYQESQASPLVRIELLDFASKEILDWRVSNYLGQFSSFDWPNNQAVVLRVKDNNFYFPIGDRKPVHLSWYDFYQGEAFAFNNDFTNPEIKNLNDRRALAIPTVLAQGKYNLPLIERIRIVLSYLLTYPWWFWFLSLILVAIFVLRYPSFPNYLALLYYLIIALFKYFHYLGSKTWQFVARYSNGYKINQNLILLINDLKQGSSQALVVAVNESLSPKLKLAKDNFVFSLQTKDYVLWDGQRAVSEIEYLVKETIIDEFKLHQVDNPNHYLKILQPHCQLLPRQ